MTACKRHGLKHLLSSWIVFQKLNSESVSMGFAYEEGLLIELSDHNITHLFETQDACWVPMVQGYTIQTMRNRAQQSHPLPHTDAPAYKVTPKVCCTCMFVLNVCGFVPPVCQQCFNCPP
eukprot:Blabericola_migrator_1__4403@NODE_2364_length_2873_cov_217_944405_g1482_i0_p3_GENE_NODE_2364_length_2873_cov_217_944405_g1482_i0NODE_2364_length_2873_cov_217_944405_g1482_i0_p3_ORF_typecomplete_len120_score10_34_NODE_2364_length_2873_cov_217_944405_g1482_i022692628